MSEIINVVTEVGIECIHLDTIDLKGFCELLSRLSVDLDLPDDAPTLLYSGQIVDGVGALDAVKNIEGVRLIRNTALGDFMESDDAVIIIKNAISNELERGTFDVELVKAQLSSEEYLKILNSIEEYCTLSADIKKKTINTIVDAYLYEANNGAWATASKEFVSKIPATSEVVCMYRMFLESGATEAEAVMDLAKVE